MQEFTFNNPSFQVAVAESSYVTNGLIMFYDFSNPKSYFNKKSIITDLSSNKCNSLGVSASLQFSSSNSITFNQADVIKTLRNPFVTESFSQPHTKCGWVYCAVYPPPGVSYAARWLDESVVAGTFESYLQWGVYGQNGLYVCCGTGLPGSNYNETTSTATYPTGNWIYMVGVFSGFAGNSQVLYINGNYVATNVYDGSVNGTFNILPLTIGGELYGGVGYYQLSGSVGQIQVYNRTLSAVEIAQNFSASKRYYGYV